jgi:prepilin-type N-terminal cleavage/methylation domain-containing protein
MSGGRKNNGFSLTEILIAVGILAVGMVFIAGVFPAGIYFTTVATERTIAAVVADEAFAKIRIYGINLSPPLSINSLCDFNDVKSGTVNDPNIFLYPSTNTVPDKQYCWSALFRRVAPDPNHLVQVTVFVCRKVNPNLQYLKPPNGSGSPVDWPAPLKIGVGYAAPADPAQSNKLRITALSERTFINDGYTIVDDATGRIYRVLERLKNPDDDIILLDRGWDASSPGGNPNTVWVVPPPVIGNPPVTHGRRPCIAVYQKVVRF